MTGIGWLLTLGWLLYSRRRTNGPEGDGAAGNPSEPRAFKQLQAACASGSAVHARQAMIDWASALFPASRVVSLDRAAEAFGDETLTAELERLNAALYSSSDTPWNGDPLAACIKRLRQQHRRAGNKQDEELALYPSAAAT